jgi:SAM-dependent methyltransferase
VIDRSNGYEGVRDEFLARRGSGRGTGIGVAQVRAWVRSLSDGATVIDLGCGPGRPITEVLVAEGLRVYGVDAAPSYVEAFRQNLPTTHVACEAVEDSTFFDMDFDGVLMWGLIFLLRPDEQRLLLERVAKVLVTGGRLLFTTSEEPATWNDAMTGLESHSLGTEEYRGQLEAVGLQVVREYRDGGRNYYFDARKAVRR